MKVVSNEGLTELIQLSKDTFIDKSTSVQATTVQLANVAATGEYSDLLNKPTIPNAQVQSDWNVTSTSSKAYILNKPTIPSSVAELSDASNYVTTNNIINVNTVALANVATTGEYNDLLNKPTLANVATSGSYNDLSDKPDIPNFTYNNTTQMMILGGNG